MKKSSERKGFVWSNPDFRFLCFIILFVILGIVIAVPLEQWWIWRDFRFAEKLAGFRIRDYRAGFENPRRCRIDIGYPYTQDTISWKTVKNVRYIMREKFYNRDYYIIRILEFERKTTPFIEDAQSLHYFLASPKSGIYLNGTRRWNLSTVFSKNGRTGCWAFMLYNKNDYEFTWVKAPEDSGYYYPCNKELYCLLDIVRNKHCLYQLALEQMQRTAVPLLQSTKRAFNSPAIEECKKILTLGLFFISDNPYPKIVVDEPDKKEEEAPVG